MALKILICETDKETQAWLTDRLTQWGSRTESVTSGLELIHAVACRPPDLILLDMVLPDVDSLAVLRRLGGGEGTASIPVVAIAPAEWIAERLADAPLSAILQKPITEKALRTALQRWLPAPGEAAVSARDVPTASGGMRQVLLVEDAALAAKMMGTLLQYAGYCVVHAANAERALQIIRRQRPAFMLLDVILPGMDGVQFVHQIQECDLRVPFAVVTGTHDPQRLSALQSLGALRVFEKPVRSDELLGFMDDFFAHEESAPAR